MKEQCKAEALCNAVHRLLNMSNMQGQNIFLLTTKKAK